MAETFLSSEAVQVYPCAYRGTNAEGKLYNPEAQLNTEFNLTNTKNINGRKSWVISWEETSKKLKCVIGGYYFDLDLSTPLGTSGTLKDSTDIYAYIKVLPMTPVDGTNTKYPAYTLSDVGETGATTTGKILDDGGEFKGVKLADSIPNGDNIVSLHVLQKSSIGWLVDSDDWSLTTAEIIDTSTQSRLSFELTTVHLNGVETGEIEELKVDKVQSYLESQIAIISPIELRTSTEDSDVNYFRVVNENPSSTDEVYIDNTVVQVASQSQDLVSNLSKSGVTTLNKETTGQYHLTGSELTSHSLLLGSIDSTGTMDLNVISELSAGELRFTNGTDHASLDVESINFTSGQDSGALNPYNIQFTDDGKGVTTYRVDTITRKPLGSHELFTLNIPSKSGTIATTDEILGSILGTSIKDPKSFSNGVVELFPSGTVRPTKKMVSFNAEIRIGNGTSSPCISLGKVVLNTDLADNHIFNVISVTPQYTNAKVFNYKRMAVIIHSTGFWKVELLEYNSADNVYRSYTRTDAIISISNFVESDM